MSRVNLAASWLFAWLGLFLMVLGVLVTPQKAWANNSCGMSACSACMLSTCPTNPNPVCYDEEVAACCNGDTTCCNDACGGDSTCVSKCTDINIQSSCPNAYPNTCNARMKDTECEAGNCANNTGVCYCKFDDTKTPKCWCP
jgi:hypothetical protein